MLRRAASQLAFTGWRLHLFLVIVVGGDASPRRGGLPGIGDARSDGSSTKSFGSFVDPSLDVNRGCRSREVSHGGEDQARDEEQEQSSVTEVTQNDGMDRAIRTML